MNILFIGDVFGKPGRRVLKERLAGLKKKHEIEFTIANGENAADGNGITPSQVDELCGLGVDLVTTGDHVWDRRELIPTLATESRLLRPSNYPDGVPGRGSVVTMTATGHKIGVLDLQGRTFMFKQILDEPFRHAKKEIARMKQETPVVIVDFHAEATSEKVAMGWYLDGEATAVLGTHTHVQTADSRILPKGTAYLTDVGMTGPADSVIGLDQEHVLEKFLNQMAPRWEVASGRMQVCGAVVAIDEKTGQAESITRIFETYDPLP
jgi:hypothetical protein